MCLFINKFIILFSKTDFSGSLSLTWRRQWHPTPVLLPGKSHGRRSLVGCRPWGREESDTTEWLHFHFSLSYIGEGNGNPLQCSCLENPRDGGAWWAAVYGVAQSRTRLKRLGSSSSIINLLIISTLIKSLGFSLILTEQTLIENSYFEPVQRISKMNKIDKRGMHRHLVARRIQGLAVVKYWIKQYLLRKNKFPVEVRVFLLNPLIFFWGFPSG